MWNFSFFFAIQLIDLVCEITICICAIALSRKFRGIGFRIMAWASVVAVLANAGMTVLQIGNWTNDGFSSWSYLIQITSLLTIGARCVFAFGLVLAVVNLMEWKQQLDAWRQGKEPVLES